MEIPGKKINVLHLAGVINRYDFIDNVIRFADPARFRMMACTFTDESNIEPPNFKQAGIPHFVLGVTGRKDYPAAILRLARILRHERVHILHTHHYDEALIGTFAALLARKPRVVIGRHYHNEIYLLTNGVKRPVLLTLEHLINRYAEGIIVPSTSIRYLLTEEQRVQQDKVWVIPYGFDFNGDRYGIPSSKEHSLVRQSLGLDGRFIVANFGRHHPLKGQDYLLHGFARFAKKFIDAHLLMVGDGQYRSHLMELATRLGLLNGDSPSVTFTGWRRDVAQLMAIADVVAQPTLHEAFPQVMVEAMAKAMPLVITDVSGARDHITHLQTGYLIPQRNSNSIYEALTWIRQHPGEAKQIGNQGRAYVLEKFDIRTVIHSLENTYMSIVQKLNGSR